MTAREVFLGEKVELQAVLALCSCWLKRPCKQNQAEEDKLRFVGGVLAASVREARVDRTVVVESIRGKNGRIRDIGAKERS